MTGRRPTPFPTTRPRRTKMEETNSNTPQEGKRKDRADLICNALTLVGLMAVIIVGGRSILYADTAAPQDAAPLPAATETAGSTSDDLSEPTALPDNLPGPAPEVTDTATLPADTLAPAANDSVAAAPAAVADTLPAASADAHHRPLHEEPADSVE